MREPAEKRTRNLNGEQGLLVWLDGGCASGPSPLMVFEEFSVCLERERKVVSRQTEPQWRTGWRYPDWMVDGLTLLVSIVGLLTLLLTTGMFYQNEEGY